MSLTPAGPAGAARPRAAPTPLRILHAIVFLGFASAAMAATHQELLQLSRALFHPFSSGTPPHLVACGAGVLAGAMSLLLVGRVGLGRGVPLWVSGLLLLAFGGSLFVLGVEPKARTVPGANVKCLESAKVLHTQLNGPLQKTGRVPSGEALELSGDSPFFERPLTPLSWHVEKVNRTDALPDGAKPGWLLLQATADAASFVITAVGIDDDGQPGLLRQDGKPVEYRGAYNPDTVK